MGGLETAKPATVVMAADVERTVLLEAVARLEGLADPTGAEQEELQSGHERLVVIGADAAPGRVEQILRNLGFSGEGSRPTAAIPMDSPYCSCNKLTRPLLLRGAAEQVGQGPLR